MTHIWHERRLNLPFLNIPPVDILEERVILDIFDIEARAGIVRQKLLYKFTGGRTHIFWQIQCAIPAFFHNNFGILSVVLVLERDKSTDHLTYQDANAPYVRLVGVPHIGHHDLGGAVARRAAICVGSIRLNVSHLLCKTEVNNFYMAVIVYEDVLRLKISINNTMLMQLLHG